MLQLYIPLIWYISKLYFHIPLINFFHWRRYMNLCSLKYNFQIEQYVKFVAFDVIILFLVTNILINN